MSRTLKRFGALLLISSFALFQIACGPMDGSSASKDYETVKGDPTNTRIYTLENGLKVYLSVNEEAPRVHTSIAVRAGSKNDPATATGLAHYLEHMLFKGTDKYGTLDFEKEGPMLDQIDSLYEVYRATSNTEEREAIYAIIDSVSLEASKLAIANEYDKMVGEMGAKGTNAYTSQERTVYINDIPTNQLEKWLTVEAERFRSPQLRLFHTELEAVYEEKNRSLDSDGSKAFFSLMGNLYPTHQYGQQTTIGTIDHLKNPSLTEIKKYFNSYYVPNNMAILLAGDFDPDSVIAMVREKFAYMETSEVPEFTVTKEEPIQGIVRDSVVGPDAEFMYMAYRFDGVGSEESELIQICDMILANSTAGLIDLNLNQTQQVLGASSFTYILSDYSAHMMNGRAKQGQSLREVEQLLLDQIDSLKEGNFPDWLPQACINDLKLGRLRQLERNRGRTSMMVNAFIQKTDWEDEVKSIEALEKYSKEDIMAFAKKHYNDNYVVVYKQNGVDTTVKSVEKPKITPVEVNRDDASPFLTMVGEMETEMIEPRFLNYSEDVTESTLENGIKVRSVKNESNDLFTLYYLFDMGKDQNVKLDMAVGYLPFLGTDKYSASEIQQEFYKIGCEFDVFASNDRVYVTLSGLNENFDQGVELFEHLMANAKPDQDAYDNMVSNTMKERADAKLSKGNILFGGMMSYATYGENNPFKNILSEEELNNMNPSELTDMINGLSEYEHRVLYYGPMDQNELSSKLEEMHAAPADLKALPERGQFTEVDNDGNAVYVVDYDMEQAEIIMLAKKKLYDPKNVAAAAIFNEYFGGGMGSIVFQEMRESKALAYSVYSVYTSPGDSSKSHYVMAYIGTQADKLPEAMAGMSDLLNDMPESEKSFELAKKAAMEKIRTERITKSSKLWNYESALKRGVEYDLRMDVYKQVPNMTIQDLRDFHHEFIENSEYNIMVIGDKNKLDMETLKSYGPVAYLSLEDVFGY